MNDLMTRLNGIRNLISTPFLLLAALSGFVYFVWHLNQLLPPELGQWLASGWARAGLVALGGAAVAWYYYRRGRQSDDRSQALVDAMPVDTLNAKFTSAGLLRRGWPPWQREDLARRPFFILIGPSQAGKTELVKVIARDGVDKKKGVGGTHYCDFFFTPDAVLIDTGGHLIERQDTENDKKGWEHFVALLKKCRPRQPVNGVIVALSLVQHAQLSESECNDKAVAIRNRLYELRKLLDMRFPVYMVFTKLDLAEGFRPFFREVEQEQRKPRWGVTLPYALEGQTEEEVPTVDPCADLDTLQQRLEYLMFVRLAEEQDLPSRPLDCAFPGQMRSLAGLAGEFVKTVFSPPSGELPLLRGVYFTSSLQERSPIDSLLARFGIHVAMAEGRDAPVRRIEKSYFVEDLFRKGVFQDLGLAGRNRSLELREARVFWASAAATVFLALALATTGWRVQQKAEEYAQQIRDDREKLDELAGPFKISAASTKAWAFFASRRAAVPQAMTVSQPKSRMTLAIWPRASSPAWKASGPISPERACPRARRTMAFSRASTRWPPMGSASTTTMWMEFEPTSTAAIRMGRLWPRGPRLGQKTWGNHAATSALPAARRPPGRPADRPQPG